LRIVANRQTNNDDYISSLADVITKTSAEQHCAGCNSHVCGGLIVHQVLDLTDICEYIMHIIDAAMLYHLLFAIALYSFAYVSRLTHYDRVRDAYRKIIIESTRSLFAGR